MTDSERYPTSRVVKMVWCDRLSCPTKMSLTSEGKLPYHAVVVSMQDGKNKYVFCGDNCAGAWLIARPS